MNLCDVKLDKLYIVKRVAVQDEKTKIRLMELGLVSGVEIVVKKKSALKETLLVVFNHSCFTMKSNVGQEIEVENA